MQSGYILIVEDVPDILRLLEETLKFKGYRAVTAFNGQERQIIRADPQRGRRGLTRMTSSPPPSHYFGMGMMF